MRRALRLALVALCCGAPASARAADAPARAADPYDPPMAVPTPTPAQAAEPAVVVRYDLGGDLTLRSKGRLAYRLEATGKLPPGAALPKRRFEGTFDVVRRIRLVGAKRRSTVEGPLDVRGAWGDAKEKAATVPLKLEFEEGPRGAAPYGSIRFTAPGLAVDDLEAFQRAFTDRFGPPDRPVRVGDVFGATEGMAVEESLLRVAFRLSQRELTGKAPLVPVPGGGVWVDGRDGTGPTAGLVVRAAITHAHQTDTDDPKDPANVHVDYRAAIEARRVLVIDGGWAKAHDAALRRKVRYTGPAYDYTIEIVQDVRFETTVEPPASPASPAPNPPAPTPPAPTPPAMDGAAGR
ncbi:MAG: hypothetical protein U1E39_11505 [Planctomycetota bacterium]